MEEKTVHLARQKSCERNVPLNARLKTKIKKLLDQNLAVKTDLIFVDNGVVHPANAL